jgi:hypothetical protein
MHVGGQVVRGRMIGRRPDRRLEHMAGAGRMSLTARGHHEQRHRRLLHDAVVVTLQPIIPPTHFLRGRHQCARLVVFDIALVAAQAAVACGDHVEFLIAARAFRPGALQPTEVLDAAVIEYVVPGALVIHRDVNKLALGGHRKLVPECGIGAASADLGQLLRRFALALEPPERIRILQHAAWKYIQQLIVRRDDDESSHQVRRRRDRGQVAGDPQCGGADHADLAIRPGLLRHPLHGIEAIGHVVDESFVKSFRMAFAAHILYDEGIAGIDVAFCRIPGCCAQSVLQIRCA